LAAVLGEVDALYVNFITGRELTAETAQELKDLFPGPIYADLHSLFLGIAPEGFRFPRELPDSRIWLDAFDAVQMNEGEFELLGERAMGLGDLLTGTEGRGLRLVTVTLGERGSRYVAAPDLSSGPGSWLGAPDRSGGGEGPKEGRVDSRADISSVDPTGCGDVWGATFFGRLLAGDPLEAAMQAANGYAARNAELRGAAGLHLHLEALPGA
jgi:sugar/nucleoside kinase (ribokinase family)